MIAIDKEAAEYIQKHGGSIIIDLKHEPAMGGCCSTTQTITGSYVPAVSTGEPEAKDKYLAALIEGVRVYYPKNLQVKEGFSQVRIKMKKTLLWSWLEIEGAKATAIYSS